ncbi:hypothetical protein J6590_071107 [Homalodisca vitripennis]|nr:hypothetical protein J6590_071107 [Homalodisca vitripennis]
MRFARLRPYQTCIHNINYILLIEGPEFHNYQEKEFIFPYPDTLLATRGNYFTVYLCISDPYPLPTTLKCQPVHLRSSYTLQADWLRESEQIGSLQAGNILTSPAYTPHPRSRGSWIPNEFSKFHGIGFNIGLTLPGGDGKDSRLGKRARATLIKWVGCPLGYLGSAVTPTYPTRSHITSKSPAFHQLIPPHKYKTKSRQECALSISHHVCKVRISGRWDNLAIKDLTMTQFDDQESRKVFLYCLAQYRPTLL